MSCVSHFTIVFIRLDIRSGKSVECVCVCVCVKHMEYFSEHLRAPNGSFEAFAFNGLSHIYWPLYSQFNCIDVCAQCFMAFPFKLPIHTHTNRHFWSYAHIGQLTALMTKRPIKAIDRQLSGRAFPIIVGCHNFWYDTSIVLSMASSKYHFS